MRTTREARATRAELHLAVTLLAATSGGCDNECDFHERCVGDEYQVCGDGADQVVGRRIRRFPCDAPNTACVERDDQHAGCVLPAETTCDDTARATCEGDVVVSCQRPVGYTDPAAEPPRYLVGADCSTEGGRCTSTDRGASCSGVEEGAGGSPGGG